MSPKPTQLEMPQEALERIFHEPSRLALMAALCAAEPDGLTFTELKNGCDLTDGNLNRHLAVLLEAGAIRQAKEFVGVKPRTTVFLTRNGLRRFSQYLDALQQALQAAQAALPAPARKAHPQPAHARAVRI
jgi:DNA-binding transcriptional ArsR family regulator